MLEAQDEVLGKKVSNPLNFPQIQLILLLCPHYSERLHEYPMSFMTSPLCSPDEDNLGTTL